MNQKHYYHISTKGLDIDLFKDEEDFRQILFFIALTFGADPQCEIVCYCIMNNHIHLVVYGILDNIDRQLVNLKKRYSMWFSNKYGVNKVWARVPSKIRKCEDYEDVKNCIGYDYYNPVKAGLTNNPFYYPWSSVSAHFRNDPFLYGSRDLELSPRAQRKVFHTHYEMPSGIKMMENGALDPLSLINPSHVNKLMKTAKSLNYFIYRNRDEQLSTHEEVYLCNDVSARQKAKEIASRICGREANLETLSKETKRVISDVLKYTYGTPAKVVTRVLGLEG
ncbi:MAG: hypothetical protein J5490_00305 [Bacteroidales bacterium]|nr:hypothetical protein [Bacteroidales bacterium]